MSVIRTARLHRIPVSWRTTWTLVEVVLEDGTTGWGEASDSWITEVVDRRWPTLTDPFLGTSLDRGLDLTRPGTAAGLDYRDATLLGGFEQALCDLAAQREGIPLAGWLGAERPADQIPLYANLNRALPQRTPELFAQVAVAAVEQGFTAIKIAPFDLLGGERRVDTGLRLAEAVRERVGDDVDLMVDLHSSLGLPELEVAAARLRDLAPCWVEDVGGPDAAHLAREVIGAPIAGGEHVTSTEQLTGDLDIVMPDVKHAGGDRAALRLGSAGLAGGARVSLHNPSGPVATAHSIAVSLALGGRPVLEYAFGEAAARRGLLGGAVGDRYGIGRDPDATGLGITPDRDWIAAHEISRI